VTEPETTPDDTRTIVPALLDRDIRLIKDAIAMVAGGHAPRVTVAGSRFAEDLLEAAQAWATQAGVRITPLWRTDESGLDLTIEARE